MKLCFSWQTIFDELEPTCQTDARFRDGDSLLADVLTDSGGLRYLTTVPWLKEGLRFIERVKSGQESSMRWGREDWGAELTKDRVKLYSLNDESYAETIDLDAFDKALRAWIDFIQTPPDAKASQTIEL